ncbi:MAG: MmgE/PrpD family protein, partial [Chloroflexota bacterium]
HGLQPSEVREVETRVHPLVLELTGKQQPRTGLEGKFSIYFCAAIALIEGNARQGQFTDEKVNRADVVALRKRVRAVVEPGLRENQAVVTVRTHDGRELVERVEAASGTPGNPVSDEELEEKFMELVAPILPRERAERLVERVRQLERLEGLSQLVELSAP